jgi:WD40 repeat protein
MQRRFPVSLRCLMACSSASNPCPSVLFRLQGHSEKVYSVAWSPVSGQLATGAADASIRLWDAASGTGAAEIEVGRVSLWSSVRDCSCAPPQLYVPRFYAPAVAGALGFHPHCRLEP